MLTTFTDALANLLRSKLQFILHRETNDKIVIDSLDAVGLTLHEDLFESAALAPRETVETLLESSASLSDTNFSITFLLAEWERVVDAWQLSSWEEYRDVSRIGRFRRLSETQRRALWPVFERVKQSLRDQGLTTRAEVFVRLSQVVGQRERPLFDYIVVDEAQDVSVAQLRFLASLAGGRPNGLFFAGDLGQRIFQQPFSWKELGVEVRGRSQTLRINYRTSHQIRTQADRLLDPEMSDVDGNLEERKRHGLCIQRAETHHTCLGRRGRRISYCGEMADCQDLRRPPTQ